MAKVFNKVMGFLGLEDEYDDVEEVVETEREEEVEVNAPVSQFNKKQSKVVNIHSSNSAKVVIMKPVTFDEVTNICDDLRNRKIVVVNTTSLDPKIAQRMLDFMSGASYALDGELQEVERGVYVLSPSTVEVTNELKGELSSKGLFSWAK
ncbi:cell division protein SepF [Clostridium sp. 19966]|uniref:cell division protein SepF n=1 Tax=Clostridium sp. 19966 TaxID=2768166 RepID=UPI0028DF9F27|nr:cell division protein SepF [Clostridium sp. 19966]MDT8716614.1 cell division protein SepF [Clostridium sp. 19966]